MQSKAIATKNSSIQLYAVEDKINFFKPNLPLQEREFIMANRSVKIKDISQKDIHIEVDGMIERIFLEIGDKFTSNKDKTMLTKIFMEDLQKHYRYLSLFDVRIALYMGVRGELVTKPFKSHNDNNINITLLHAWLKEYRQHQDRASTLNAQIMHDRGLDDKKHQDQHDQRVKNDLRRFIEEFCTTYDECLQSNKPMVLKNNIHLALYSFLKNHKFLNLSKSEIADKWERAIKTVIANYEAAATIDMRATARKRVMIGNIPTDFEKLKEFESTLEVEDLNTFYFVSIDIQWEARRTTIIEFIQESIAKKRDLSQELRKIKI